MLSAPWERCFRRVLSSLCVAAVCGCASSPNNDPWTNRYGPDPALPGTLVNASADNQVIVMQALYKVARDPQGGVSPYNLTLAGFNFVDEQCDLYLHELFVIDQDRDKIKSAIDSAGLLTNAALAVSPASKLTMAVVTQAFGLSSQYTDTIANSYLYGVHPSTIFNIISKLQGAYRDQAEADMLKITSEPAAYARIRGYLQLCLPASIESKINETLSTSIAVSGKAATGSTVSGPGSGQATRLVTP